MLAPLLVVLVAASGPSVLVPRITITYPGMAGPLHTLIPVPSRNPQSRFPAREAEPSLGRGEACRVTKAGARTSSAVFEHSARRPQDPVGAAAMLRLTSFRRSGDRWTPERSPADEQPLRKAPDAVVRLRIASPRSIYDAGCCAALAAPALSALCCWSAPILERWITRIELCMSDSLTEQQVAELPEYLEDDQVEEGAAVTSPKAGLFRFARMTGSSIAGRDAAGWVTDFLNAAYYRRSVQERDVDDLRLAFCVLTTYWYRKPGHGRLHVTDLPVFHRAFGKERFATGDSSRGTLSRAQLLDGAERLLGGWFSAAYADDSRRGWGIAFETAEDRAAYDPESRMKLARVGELTPERAPMSTQTWHTYPPVRMPSAEAVVAALTAPETWPDYASEIGRFTPLRAGGLAGQTFEIEVAAGTGPVFTRGYVTITKLVTPDDPEALRTWVTALEDGLQRFLIGMQLTPKLLLIVPKVR